MLSKTYIQFIIYNKATELKGEVSTEREKKTVSLVAQYLLYLATGLNKKWGEDYIHCMKQDYRINSQIWIVWELSTGNVLIFHFNMVVMK